MAEEFVLKYQALDRTGKRYGKLVALRPDGYCGTNLRWLCQCDCGKLKSISGSSLKQNGNGTQSCCILKTGRKKRKRKSFTVEMLRRAKCRASKHGLPFNLTIEDIVIPDKCPILGMSLKKEHGPMEDGSPSLDRVIPKLGYVKGNVHIISNKANRIKNDATLAELLSVTIYFMKLHNMI